MEEKDAQTASDQSANKPTADKPAKAQAKQKNSLTNATLAYAVFWVTGLVFLLVEKDDEYVRFHAAQSLLVFGVLNLVMLVPIVGWMLTPIISLVTIVLWVVLMVFAYQGKQTALPGLKDYIDKVKNTIGK